MGGGSAFRGHAPNRAFVGRFAMSHQLIASARARSPDSVSAVIEACRSYLLLVAEREVDGRLQAKIAPSDIVQETLIKAHQHFAEFRGEERKELLGWLRTILVREIAMAKRRFEAAQKRDARLEMSLDPGSAILGAAAPLLSRGPSPSRQAMANEQALRIEYLLCRLPADYQTVIRLRYWNHLSLSEVGNHMQRSRDAARKLWARAVERLAFEWEQVYGDEERSV